MPAPVQTGRPPSEEEQFYLAWGRESLKTNLQLVNNVLQQFLTLSASLAGGSVLFLSKDTIPAHLITPVLLLFMGALVASLVGMFPYVGNIDLASPVRIKLHKERALRYKRRWMGAAFVLLIAGLGLAVYGVWSHDREARAHAQTTSSTAARPFQ